MFFLRKISQQVVTVSCLNGLHYLDSCLIIGSVNDLMCSCYTCVSVRSSGDMREECISSLDSSPLVLRAY